MHWEYKFYVDLVVYHDFKVANIRLYVTNKLYVE